MNIVGEGINPKISDQIKVRQNVYGSLNRDPEQIEYLNSRTAFARLVSSVNVTEKFNPASAELKTILNDIRGNTLAKRFTLFNGTTNEALNLQRSGIARDGSIINPNAYGLGGLEFGIRPMPGIVSANTKTENRGSLRTTTIQIKAWNRVQFEIIDILYLRLGYSVLFEFGNTIFFKNDGRLIKDVPYSLADTFLAGDYTVSTLLKRIQELRLESDGNYDAIYGKVVNFSWEFVEDGSYDITVIIRSIGDVIESLKVNVLIDDITIQVKAGEEEEKEETAQETQEPPSIESYTDKHQIGKLLFNAKTALGLSTKTQGGCKVVYSNLFKNIPQVKGKKHFLQQDYDKGESQYYIRLGSLLAYIENVIVPKYTNGSNVGEPILNFDYLDNNIIYTVPNQISTDPRVCLINNSIKFSSGTYLYAPQGDPYVTQKANYDVGQVMNIYVNFMYILTTMDANLDNNNKVPLIDLLKNLLNGISNALGAINTLEPFYDEITNTIKIVDQSTLPGKYKILEALEKTNPDSTTKLNLYGYYYSKIENDQQRGSAGFVRNFGIKTEITPNLATMLSIGAQAAGSVVGEDATALSKLNEGLRDRIKNDVVDAITKSNEPEKSKLQELNERFPNANRNFSEAAKKLGSFNNSKPTWDVESIDSYTQLQVNFLSYVTSKEAISTNKPSGTIGFIPVNLNLTLDGLSGLKIYNTLRVDTSYLPSNYPTAMDFIITGLSHTIQNNVWTTDLTTIMVPRDVAGSPGNKLSSGASGAAGANTSTNDRGSSRVTPAVGNCKADDQRLSPNFLLSQLSCNAVVAKYFVPSVSQTKTTNRGSFIRQQIIDNLRAVAVNILEPIKAAYPTAFPTNGYRNKGGNSQHEIGEAVDIQFSDMANLSIRDQNALMLERAKAIQKILQGKNGFDQMLLEYKTTRGGKPWIHISYRKDGANRNEIRTFLNDVTARNGNGKFYNALA